VSWVRSTRLRHLYAIGTAVLGAIMVTGFSGRGAICAHVRIGELGSPPEIISLLLGAMTWGGLYAPDPRNRVFSRSSVEPTGGGLLFFFFFSLFFLFLWDSVGPRNEVRAWLLLTPSLCQDLA